ncbi:MAG: hypothetical protein JWO36_180 [Myxococcales bacterium]|nr:hypothetical protein [Myxococcales bacterium]
MRDEAVRAFSAALAAPRATQDELLRSILEANRLTAYGRHHDFASITDVATYRSRVPFVRFPELSPWVDRMLAGEPDVLLAGQPIFFGRTSGTTGRPKHVGYPSAVSREYVAAYAPMASALEAAESGASREVLFVTGTFAEARTAHGIPIGSASGFVRNLDVFRDESYFHIAPEEVFELTDTDARYYLLLRLALERPLRTIGALNPSSVILLFKKAREYGAALADDLARGSIEAGPEGARALAARLGLQLSPRPDVAERMTRALADGRFQPEVAWPTLRVLQTWKGGASRHYFSALTASCPNARVWPALSGSTEGLLLVPLREAWTGGVPALCSTVIEAMPAEVEPCAEAILPFEALEEGRGYRFAITNRRGLYRYVMDDVFVVAERHAGVPVLHFSHRLGAGSSLTGEKLTEADVIAGANAALELVQAVDFQVAPEWDDPPRYVLLVELSAVASDAALEEALRRFEVAMAASNVEYAAKRSSGRLAAPTLLVLRAGSFDRLRRELSTGKGKSDAQVKIARLGGELVDRDKLDLLHAVAWPV